MNLLLSAPQVQLCRRNGQIVKTHQALRVSGLCHGCIAPKNRKPEILIVFAFWCQYHVKVCFSNFLFLLWWQWYLSTVHSYTRNTRKEEAYGLQVSTLVNSEFVLSVLPGQERARGGGGGGC